MDGGNLTINNNGEITTVWRREAKIYTANPGMAEKEIGEGKGCTMEISNDSTIYAWIEDGRIVVVKSNGDKQLIGEGSQPVLKSIDANHLICVWENDKTIHAAVLQL